MELTKKQFKVFPILCGLSSIAFAVASFFSMLGNGGSFAQVLAWIEVAVLLAVGVLALGRKKQWAGYAIIAYGVLCFVISLVGRAGQIYNHFLECVACLAICAIGLILTDKVEQLKVWWIACIFAAAAILFSIFNPVAENAVVLIFKIFLVTFACLWAVFTSVEAKDESLARKLAAPVIMLVVGGVLFFIGTVLTIEEEELFVLMDVAALPFLIVGIVKLLKALKK